MKVVVKLSISFLALLFSHQPFAQEQCPLDDLKQLNYLAIQCQFYLRTQAYRARTFTIAAAHWQNVIDSQSQTESEKELQSSALSNLTFLRYTGQGVEKDKATAVAAWKKAAAQGDLEPRRHLGYAYSDKDFKERNQITSLAWYKATVSHYLSMKTTRDSDRNVYNDALSAIATLEEDMSALEIKAAEAKAKTLEL